MTTDKAKANATARTTKRYATTLRLNKATAGVLHAVLAKANKKDGGKRIRAEQAIALGLSLIGPEHIEKLQQSSLSNADRFEALFKQHAARNRDLTKDQFIGMLIDGKVLDKREAAAS